jgi:hypothetical protein
MASDIVIDQIADMGMKKHQSATLNEIDVHSHWTSNSQRFQSIDIQIGKNAAFCTEFEIGQTERSKYQIFGRINLLDSIPKSEITTLGNVQQNSRLEQMIIF